jgi:hypothetical protein
MSFIINDYEDQAKYPVETLDVCYLCGANRLHTRNSLDFWAIEYTCGAEVGGPISSPSIEALLKCPCTLL